MAFDLNNKNKQTKLIMRTQHFINQTLSDLGLKSVTVLQNLTIKMVTSNAVKNIYQKSNKLQTLSMRKINKITIAIMAIAVLSVQSCKKDFNNPINPGNEVNKPGKFNEIKTQQGFNWNTHNKVDFIFKAVPTISEVKATLSIVQLPENKLIVSVMHKMNESLNMPLNLPAHVKQLKVSYGTNQKTIDIVGNKAEFDLTQLFPDDSE